MNRSGKDWARGLADRDRLLAEITAAVCGTGTGGTPSTRDALALAEKMLAVIRYGGSINMGIYIEGHAQIKRALYDETARAAAHLEPDA